MSSQDVDKQRDELERRSKRLFDESAARLDARTRSRLTQARSRALQELGKSRWFVGRPARWAPAGALAASAVVAWLLWQGDAARDADLQVAALSDVEMEILLAEEDLGLLEELEFYDWLEGQPEFASPEPAGDGVG